RAVVLLDSLPLFVAGDHRPEVFFVRLHSVEAAVDPGDHRGDQYPFPLTQTCGIVHDLTVQIEAVRHGPRAQGLDLGDVRHEPRPVPTPLVDRLQLTRSGVLRNRLPPRHVLTSSGKTHPTPTAWIKANLPGCAQRRYGVPVIGSRCPISRRYDRRPTTGWL